MWLSKISSWSQVTNGAPPTNAPLVTLVTNGAPAGGAPLVVLQKTMIVVAHVVSGAPLLVKLVIAHCSLVHH